MRPVLLGLIWLCGSCARHSGRELAPEVTARTHGPYRIVRNAILDVAGRPFLLRGTHVAPLTENTKPRDGFDPLSATALITIRQRLNMNAIRVALDPAEYVRSEEYRARADRLLHLANDLELLVVVEASSPDDAFWPRIATRFRDEPDVFFAPLHREFVAAIRNAGARQPVIVEGDPLPDPGAIYQVSPRYAGTQAVWDRMRAAAEKVPVLADGLDPELAMAGGECSAFPADPGAATKLVETKLAWLDQQQISSTLSSFTAGHLVTDYWGFNGTKLDDGWTCRQPTAVPAGLGIVLLSHLWRASPLGLFAVSQSRGGLELGRGAIATVYGPTLADEDLSARSPLPTELGNISVQITDSRDVVRLAPLLYTGAGWSFVNFIVPEECATGPAELAIVRKDGSTAKSRVQIRDVAPALLTAPSDGRGAAVAFVTQHGGTEKSVPAWTCEGGCRTLPIPFSRDGATTVQLLGSGFRFARDTKNIRAVANGIPVPVVSVAPAPVPGNDQLTIQLPDSLIGAGEVEFYFRVDGELSNVVLLNCGSARGAGS